MRLRVPQTNRGSKARIKFEVHIKTPSTGGLSARNGDGVPYLFWWESASIRTNDGTGAVSALHIFTGSTQRAELAYTYAAVTYASQTIRDPPTLAQVQAVNYGLVAAITLLDALRVAASVMDIIQGPRWRETGLRMKPNPFRLKP